MLESMHEISPRVDCFCSWHPCMISISKFLVAFHSMFGLPRNCIEWFFSKIVHKIVCVGSFWWNISSLGGELWYFLLSIHRCSFFPKTNRPLFFFLVCSRLHDVLFFSCVVYRSFFRTSAASKKKEFSFYYLDLGDCGRVVGPPQRVNKVRWFQMIRQRRCSCCTNAR